MRSLGELSSATDAVPAPPAPGTRWRAGLRALRPAQWTKNLLVSAGWLFTGGEGGATAGLQVALACGLFCLLSSAGYLLNDVLDQDRDRLHPRKRQRPMAAGAVGTRWGLGSACVLAALGIGGAWWLDRAFALVALGYLAVSVSYSLFWKWHVLLDLMAIAAGFVLRAVAGTVLLQVELSPWLFVCVFLLALLLALGKRRHELALLEGESSAHRPSLAGYTPLFLDHALTMVAGAATVTYALYAITSPAAERNPGLVYTVPPVMYAILRYLWLVFARADGGQPEELFLTDRPLQGAMLVWLALIVGCIFGSVFR
jgi:4-hydroxybenzoate polyprenyltransferase